MRRTPAMARFGFSMLAIACLAAPASAEDLPTTPADCLKQTISLSKDAEAKKLATGTLEKIEDLLTKMETLCEAKDFPGAVAVAADVKKAIATP